MPVQVLLSPNVVGLAEGPPVWIHEQDSVCILQNNDNKDADINRNEYSSSGTDIHAVQLMMSLYNSCIMLTELRQPRQGTEVRFVYSLVTGHTNKC